MINFLLQCGKSVYWAAVGYIPISIFRFSQKYAASIGCPKAGDCYVPGWEHLLSMDLMFFFSAAVLWPLVVWKIGGYLWPMLAKSESK
jgi:hypothetical protein